MLNQSLKEFDRLFVAGYTDGFAGVRLAGYMLVDDMEDGILYMAAYRVGEKDWNKRKPQWLPQISNSSNWTFKGESS